MTPENIAKAIQEVLREIDETPKPANEVLNAYTRARRYIGSKDRRAIQDGVWQTLRKRPWPEWLKKIIPETELQALHQEAPIILRCNGDKEKIQEELAIEGIETEPTKLSPIGLILKKRIPLTTCKAYLTGQVEVQDEGSQLVALATKIKAGDSVLDYCAGAGGKSLCFAQMMDNKGRIIAHDISKKSLDELKKRAERAGTNIIEITQKPTGTFNHVVVDAPCSGSGTWRRCPDAPFKLKPDTLKEVQKKQADILDKASQFVTKDGLLHYMTCSLIEAENQEQMCTFLKRHADFKLIHHTQWSPAKNGTDGFFLASFKRTKNTE
ncbi:MAG: RsmB/NOP family class I SAM-dependent RNA methyltransferase [Alphaproteobacteria bacterium]|nr:RsmB/NOP family class I SAM-dependent RNA methyltransferase [Alphaproteobacteria bacterium]